MVIKNRSSYNSSFDVHQNKKLNLLNENQLRKTPISSSSASSKRSLSITSENSQARPSVLKAKRPSTIRRLGPVLSILAKVSLYVGLCYYILSLSYQITYTDSAIKDIRHVFDTVEHSLVENIDNIEKSVAEMKLIQSDLELLLPEDTRQETSDGNSEVMYQQIDDMQTATMLEINGLQNYLAELIQREAVDQFGSESNRVLFTIRTDGDSATFVVELAGIHLMPHSVHYFMQMVKAEVWDQTIFTHHSHLLLAELMDEKENDKYNLLEENNLPSKLAFPEYNEKYPHHKYTLGFAGRPGGPGFYINTNDGNVQDHGPGGQKNYDMSEEADPCFGIVVEGENVIDWMQMKTDMLIRDKVEGTAYTVIESVRIIQ